MPLRTRSAGRPAERLQRRRLATKPVNNAISSNPNAPPPPFEPPDELPDEPPLVVAATTATDTWLCADELRESVQVTVYVKFPTVLAVWLAVPDVARLPDHDEPFAPPPVAAHEEALVDDQVRVRV